MDDVWILGVAHQKLYVYHMRPRVLYPTPNCALLAQLLLFLRGMTSMPAARQRRAARGRSRGEDITLKTARAENRKEQADLSLAKP